MSKIMEVKNNKKLVLKQVLIKKLRNIPIEQLEEEIRNFKTDIQLLSVQIIGPLITKNYGMNIHEDGRITTDYDLMVQANNYEHYSDHFNVEKKLHCENCVYIRFSGNSEDMQYAYSKLDIYFYENDLESNGIIYNVFVSENSEQVVLDIFRPVTSL